jgi:gluconokinase
LNPKSGDELVIGIDLGTSATKVLAYTPAGEIVASASQSYALRTPEPDAVELDADEVERAALAALRAVVHAARPHGTVRAVGFSCAMHSFLPVDERGEPIGALITWMDRRSASVAERWHADGTAQRLYERTGAPIHPMLPSCKLRWFAEHDPAYVARAAKFVSLKELMVHRWTGDWLVDYGMASGTGLFDLRARVWDAAALAAAEVSPAKLSTPASTRTMLQLRSGMAAALGLPEDAVVVLASSDGALANLGVGAIGAGEFALTIGTSGALRVVVDEPQLDAAARTFCYAYDDERYVAGGATSSAGAVLEKFASLFFGDAPAAERFSRALAEAVQCLPGANGITILPFLAGERAPYWRSDLRGAMVGLELDTTRAAILRAAFESVAYALRSVYAVLLEKLPAPTRLRLSGGLAREPFVRQLFADVLAVATTLAGQEEASAFGAAMTAAMALGFVPDDAAVAALLKPHHEHTPSARSSDAYDAAFARYGAEVRRIFDLGPPGAAPILRAAP